MATTVVFGGGPTDEQVVRAALAGVTPDRVIAADSGLGACLAAGLHCDLVVGDMDSVDPGMLEAAAASGTGVERHDPDKDATDLELALDRAAEAPCEQLVVIGSSRGRLDHLLATAVIVGSPRYAGCDIEVHLGRAQLVPVHDSRTVAAPVGSTASLLALHGRVTGVSVTGMRWTLTDATLDATKTVGVSNVFEAEHAEFAVDHGVLTVVIPDQREL